MMGNWSTNYSDVWVRGHFLASGFVVGSWTDVSRARTLHQVQKVTGAESPVDPATDSCREGLSPG